MVERRGGRFVDAPRLGCVRVRVRAGAEGADEGEEGEEEEEGEA